MMDKNSEIYKKLEHIRLSNGLAQEMLDELTKSMKRKEAESNILSFLKDLEERAKETEEFAQGLRCRCLRKGTGEVCGNKVPNKTGICSGHHKHMFKTDKLIKRKITYNSVFCSVSADRNRDDEVNYWTF
jgi:hypothetical protein